MNKDHCCRKKLLVQRILNLCLLKNALILFQNKENHMMNQNKKINAFIQILDLIQNIQILVKTILLKILQKVFEN